MLQALTSAKNLNFFSLTTISIIIKGGKVYFCLLKALLDLCTQFLVQKRAIASQVPAPLAFGASELGNLTMPLRTNVTPVPILIHTMMGRFAATCFPSIILLPRDGVCF